MASGIYVLIMIWATGHSYGGVGTVTQEFNSYENCEAARSVLQKAHDAGWSERAVLRAQGYFKK